MSAVDPNVAFRAEVSAIATEMDILLDDLIDQEITDHTASSAIAQALAAQVKLLKAAVARGR